MAEIYFVGICDNSSSYIFAFFVLVGLFEASDLWEKEFENFLIIVAFISWALFIHFSLMSIKCPKCNKSPQSLDGISKSFKNIILRKRCWNCGYDLTGRSNEE